MNALRTALRTLTVFPLPAEDSFSGADALYWFPVVGAVLGAVLVGMAAGGEHLMGMWDLAWPEGIAVLVLVVHVCSTGALHLDGLADWADACAGRNAEERLTIMADSMVGTFGVLAIVISVLLRFVALKALISAGVVVWIVPVLVAARTGQVHLCVRCTYARNGGTGSTFVRDARLNHWFVAAGSAALILGVGFGATGLMVGFAGVLIAEGFGWWNTVRLGGVTGDVLGACNEWIDVLLLAGFAMGSDRLPEAFSVLEQLF